MATITKAILASENAQLRLELTTALMQLEAERAQRAELVAAAVAAQTTSTPTPAGHWVAIVEADDDYGQPTARELGQYATRAEAEEQADFGARFVPAVVAPTPDTKSVAPDGFWDHKKAQRAERAARPAYVMTPEQQARAGAMAAAKALAMSTGRTTLATPF